MLKKLLKVFATPGWQHEDAQVRREAVQSLDPVTDEATLLDIACTDSESSVRHAAVKRINNSDALLSLLQRFDSDEHSLFDAILQQLGTPLTDSVRERMLQLAQQNIDLATRLAISGYDEALAVTALDIALGAKSDAANSVLMDIIGGNGPAANKLIAVQRLRSEEQLTEAEKLTRNRDKRANRRARDRLELLRQTKAQIDESEQKLSAMLSRMQARIATTQSQITSAATHGARNEAATSADPGESSGAAVIDPLAEREIQHIEHAFAMERSSYVQLSESLQDYAWQAPEISELEQQLAAQLEQWQSIQNHLAEIRAQAAAAPEQDGAEQLGTGQAAGHAQDSDLSPKDSNNDAGTVGAETATAPAEPHQVTVAALQQLDDALRSGERSLLDSESEIRTALQLEAQRWQQLQEESPATPATLARYESLVDQFQALLEAAERIRQVDYSIDSADEHSNDNSNKPPTPVDTKSADQHQTPAESYVTDGSDPSAPAEEAHNPLAALAKTQQRRKAAKDALDAIRAQQQALNWPRGYPLPPPAQHLKDLYQKQQALLRACDEQLNDAAPLLEQLCERLEQEIGSGAFRSAIATRAEGRKLLQLLPRRAAGKNQARFNALAAQLQEMQDWQEFATHPKRTELLESMQQLAENPLEPEAQADKVKALRAQWRSLGAPRTSDDRAMADQFNIAADQAFEPCRAFFAEQAQVRDSNLQQRQQLLTQLQELVEQQDWANADWKFLDNVLRTARNEWRSYTPVDWQKNKAIQASFDETASTLADELHKEYQRRMDAKAELVKQARDTLEKLGISVEKSELAEASDKEQEPEQEHEQETNGQTTESVQGNQEAQISVQDATETMKQLQLRWKEIGANPRRKDQKLWKEFRGLCDLAFSARDADRQARDAQTDANESQAKALIAELQDTPIEALSAAALRDTRSALEQLNLRRATATILHREIDELADTLRAQKAQQALNAQGQRCSERLQLDKLFSDAERAAREAQAPQPTAAELQSITEQAQLSDVCPDSLTRQRTAASAAQAPTELTEDHVAQAMEQARMLCIEAELLAGLESPDSEQDLRMQVQVKRLGENLGGGGASSAQSTNHSDALEALVTAYLKLNKPGIGADELAMQHQRLEKVIAALIDASSQG